jgi:hypothetical protein
VQDRLLGRGKTSGTGAPEAILLGTNLSLSGNTLNAAGGTVDNAGGLVFGATAEAVSMTPVNDVATFTYGANAKAAHRTALGSTTVGDSLFTLTNPSAITFPRINANNTVTALSNTDFRNALGLGTGDSPTFSTATLGGASSTGILILRFGSGAGYISFFPYDVKVGRASSGVLSIYNTSAATADADLKLRNLIADNTVQLKSFTVGTLPSVTPAGATIYVSNESGGAVTAFSDGTNWRRVTDRAIVS